MKGYSIRNNVVLDYDKAESFHFIVLNIFQDGSFDRLFFNRQIQNL